MGTTNNFEEAILNERCLYGVTGDGTRIEKNGVLVSTGIGAESVFSWHKTIADAVVKAVKLDGAKVYVDGIDMVYGSVANGEVAYWYDPRYNRLGLARL